MPYLGQLKHIYEVKEGRECPEVYTANSIRSVLEYFFRICMPNKAKNIFTIIEYIDEKFEISINRTLLNSSSHGHCFEPAADDEIIKACEDTIAVISKLAPGQITSIKKKIADEEGS